MIGYPSFAHSGGYRPSPFPMRPMMGMGGFHGYAQPPGPGGMGAPTPYPSPAPPSNVPGVFRPPPGGATASEPADDGGPYMTAGDQALGAPGSQPPPGLWGSYGGGAPGAPPMSTPYPRPPIWSQQAHAVGAPQNLWGGPQVPQGGFIQDTGPVTEMPEHEFKTKAPPRIRRTTKQARKEEKRRPNKMLKRRPLVKGGKQTRPKKPKTENGGGNDRKTIQDIIDQGGGRDRDYGGGR